MAHNENLKIAHVAESKGKYLLSFTKLATTFVPPGVLFGTNCKLLRGGVENNSLGVWNPKRNGVIPGELEIGDTVHFEVKNPDDFYLHLLAHEEQHPGMIVWVDPDLKTEFDLNRQAA